jgi:hypothetical protein
MRNTTIEKLLNKTNYLEDADAIQIKKFTTIYYFKNTSNCKLCTFENLNALFYAGTLKDNIELFNKLLSLTGKRMFFIHVTDKNFVKKLSSHYKLIYCQEVPLGYGTGMQYHCTFLINSNDPIYSKRVDDKNGYNDITDKFKNILINIKPNIKPIVDKNLLIESFIKKASVEDINKLRSYKQQKRKNDLIEKINNKQ